MGLAAILSYIGLRAKSVAIAELQFPVLVIPEDQSNVFIASDVRTLTQAKMGASNTPRNGVTVIDAGFNIYSEQNVKCDQGGGGMLFRAFVRPGAPLTFQFNLRSQHEKGLAAARDRILRSAYLGVDADAAERWRKQLADQTTMDGIIAVLNAVVS
jgi:hypothetical protein